MKHVVKQGEHLASIAARYGFYTLSTIWDDAGNAGLKQKRGNFNVLFPGDEIEIPPLADNESTVGTSMSHKFVRTGARLVLRIDVRDLAYAAMADVEYTLEVGGIIEQKRTSGEGRIEREVPASAELGMLWVADESVPIRVGHLDPVEELSGQKARLNNLGYDAGAADELVEGDDYDFRSAVEEFQCDQELPVTGDCDATTRARLLEVHGS